MGLSKKVTEGDFTAFSADVRASITQMSQAITALTGVVQTVLPPQEEEAGDGYAKPIDARGQKDVEYEDAISTLMKNIATKGVKLVTLSGRFGAETHSMSQMQANELMLLQKEKKAYGTRLR